MAAHTTHNPTGNVPADQTQEVSPMSTIDSFLADRAAWKAAGCPADHPYLTGASAQPTSPAECLTGLVPDWAVAATRTPEVRAMLDAARDRRFG